MSKVRVGRFVVTMRAADTVDPARLGRQLATEVGIQLARQAVPGADRIRLELPGRPGATGIRAQVANAMPRTYRGRA